MQMGIRVATDLSINIGVILTDSFEIKKTLERGTTSHNCTTNLHEFSIEVIPREWNLLANELAKRGRGLPEITLFHKGKELPYWLMRRIKKSGFQIN